MFRRQQSKRFQKLVTGGRGPTCCYQVKINYFFTIFQPKKIIFLLLLLFHNSVENQVILLKIVL